MEDKRYRTYADLTLDELEQVTQDLENMSIVALEHGKWRFQRNEFDTKWQNIFSGLVFPSQASDFPKNNEK